MCIYNFISDVTKTVKTFEKKVKSCVIFYKDPESFKHYKMNYYDYFVLYTLWEQTGKKYLIEEYLVLMYSYYKIEEFYFSTKLFKSSKCIEILLNTNVSHILEELISIQ
jgi:hypothetical protein